MIINNDERGINQKIFGPIIWQLLHNISYIYENDYDNFKDKIDINTFLFSVKRVLPCSMCADHMNEYITNYIPYKPDMDFVEYLIKFHNIVTKRVLSKSNLEFNKNLTFKPTYKLNITQTKKFDSIYIWNSLFMVVTCFPSKPTYDDINKYNYFLYVISIIYNINTIILNISTTRDIFFDKVYLEYSLYFKHQNIKDKSDVIYSINTLHLPKTIL